ncbi:DUF4931 domain-containing protein [Candidatus Woesearchaeota archaeon]|nr:DUF4931 domain-containing protein [Candidatus Woesearchaeota archaeon]
MELRKDYALERWVIIASGRSKRPQERREAEGQVRGVCYFCPGNERFTPPEIGRLGGRRWRFRWFANKFPAVEPKGNPEARTDNEFFTFADAYGIHEIVVETPSSAKQLWDLKHSELVELFSIYNSRIGELSKADRIKYVSVFKNHGVKGGASLRHSHTQIIASAVTPPVVNAEAESCSGKCPYCRIIGTEKNSFRRCFENETAAAFTPYASRFNYELWIFPKIHRKTLGEFSENEMRDFTELLHNALKRLKTLNVSYNYFIHYSPDSADLHFHLELAPRISNWAGFELSSGIVINTVSPEDAARFYRGESRF